MDALTLAAWSFPVLLLLIFLRLPIGLANRLGPFIVRNLG